MAGGGCQQLAGVTGDGQSGCRTCRELFQAWTLLQREATQRAEYLGQELGGALAVPVEGAGEGSVDGSASQEVCCAVMRGVKGCVQSCTDQS